MVNSNQLTVGLIATISPELYDVWGTEVRERAYERLTKVRVALEAMGAHVVDPGAITTSNALAAAHGRMLRDQGAQVLVIYVVAWSYGSTAVNAAVECGVPAIVWTDPNTYFVGIVGASVVRGSLEEAGVPNTMIYGDIDDPNALTKLKVTVLGFAAASRLRGLTYGLMGSRSLGMLTTVIDSNFWRRKFGIEVDAWDQLEVVQRAQALPDHAVEQHLQWTRQTFGPISVNDMIVRAQLKLYVACKQIIAEHQFDMVSVRCLPEMPGAFTTFCYAIALLNDTSDAEGPKEAVCCSCESDSNGALTMQILKYLGGAPVLFGDVRHIGLDDRQLWISNCGSSATELAPSRKDVHWVAHGFKEYTWKIGAMTPQYVAKAGRVTLARMTRVAGDYVMLIAGGECIQEPRSKLDETFWEFSPHCFIRLDADPRTFAEELRCNHLHMVYGDFQPHLMETCRVLGIRPIVVA